MLKWFSPGKTGNLRAVEHREIRGRSEKEREALPCGIKPISLLSLHQNLAFELVRRSSISGRRQQQAAPLPAGTDLLPERTGDALHMPHWGTRVGQALPEATREAQRLAWTRKTPLLTPENAPIYLPKFPDSMN